jgi:hypothetical protein
MLISDLAVFALADVHIAKQKCWSKYSIKEATSGRGMIGVNAIAGPTCGRYGYIVFTS